ncbi:MAG: class II fumarate hydratase [Acidimicrobiales bacterium]
MVGIEQTPAEIAWGAQTQLAIENFPISGRPVDPRLLRALARIKAAAGTVNGALADVPTVDTAMGRVIAEIASEIADGASLDQFPIDVFQTGSGTSTNMNMNEVVATFASRRLGRAVHPNDHVNASQSSNDVIPSAIRIAAAAGVVDELLPVLERLTRVLRRKSREFATVVKAGRTHLMDATPITLGAEFGAYATQIDLNIDRLRACIPRVCMLPLGGTAVGTGINAPRQFAPRVVRRLANSTSLPLRVARDRVARQSAQDELVELSSHLRTLAMSLVKVANDVRWMASGPHSGLNEIELPALQAGSSIMPGKVNPVLCEVVTQVAVQVFGNDASVAFAGSQGSFELNTYLPVIAHNVLESITLLTNATREFTERCVSGIIAHEEVCRDYAERSPAIAAALNERLGYDRVAEAVHEAERQGVTVREVVRERGWLSARELDALLDVQRLASPQ